MIIIRVILIISDFFDKFSKLMSLFMVRAKIYSELKCRLEDYQSLCDDS